MNLPKSGEYLTNKELSRAVELEDECRIFFFY